MTGDGMVKNLPYLNLVSQLPPDNTEENHEDMSSQPVQVNHITSCANKHCCKAWTTYTVWKTAVQHDKMYNFSVDTTYIPDWEKLLRHC